ncbi:MAG: hypothetical protein KAW39_00710 [Thermoplasmata archaeon]|nr:hypothetical protein [Thermoplasmata archaeon]
MTEDERGIDSRKDWIDFIDMLIGLRGESSRMYSNLFWLVLPLLVTVGWATFQFMYSVKVNLEIFAVSLLFLSLLSLAASATVYIFLRPPRELRATSLVDEERRMRVIRVIGLAGLFPYSISIGAIVLLWRDFDNLVGHILLAFLIFEVLVNVGILLWRKALEKVIERASSTPSQGASRLLPTIVTSILPFLAIIGLAWNELWNGIWFLPFELAILEGGVVLGILSLWSFSFTREYESERLDNLISLRFEITRRGLDAEEIAKTFKGGPDALSRLFQPTDEPADGDDAKTHGGK